MWWLQLRSDESTRISWNISFASVYSLLINFEALASPSLNHYILRRVQAPNFFFGDHEYSTLAHETMIYHFIFLSCLDISDVDIKCHTLFILHTRAISLILHINPSNHTTWIRRDFLSNLRGECLGILALYLYGSHDHSTRHLHTNNRQLRHGFYTAKIPKNHCTIQWRILLLPKHSGR